MNKFFRELSFDLREPGIHIWMIPVIATLFLILSYAIERMARCLLPMMQKYYKSTEGKEELAAENRAEEKQSA